MCMPSVIVFRVSEMGSASKLTSKSLVCPLILDWQSEYFCCGSRYIYFICQVIYLNGKPDISIEIMILSSRTLSDLVRSRP